MPRDLGGLGIKDLGLQNIYLMLKLLHKLHCNRDSASATWVRRRACVASLTGDIYGGHWDVLRVLLPLYQALTSIQLGDGSTSSFWRDVWYEDDTLADVYPALFSHCSSKEITVKQVLQEGLQQFLVPRLSLAVASELQQVEHILSSTTLSTEPDKRVTPFTKEGNALDTRTLYRLLKARGQQRDDRVVFVWQNHAPPRV
jgi:hypothetical protein